MNEVSRATNLIRLGKETKLNFHEAKSTRAESLCQPIMQNILSFQVVSTHKSVLVFEVNLVNFCFHR